MTIKQIDAVKGAAGYVDMAVEAIVRGFDCKNISCIDGGCLLEGGLKKAGFDCLIEDLENASVKLANLQNLIDEGNV